MEKVTEKAEHSLARREAVTAVIVNVKRLIKDAELLLANGSPGSSLSLAILAFEEAGKGHVIELALEKPKAVHSKHEFRHTVALQILSASLAQKYQIDMQIVGMKIEERHKKETTQSNGRPVMPPMTDTLHDELRAEILPQIQKMTADDIQSFGIESRWLNKIVAVVNNGGLERLRQSGLYLDTNRDLSITSSPASIEPIDAQRWIWAAGRVLNLLERGAYHQPYSPLAELISAAAGGDEKAKEVLEIAKSFALSPRR